MKFDDEKIGSVGDLLRLLRMQNPGKQPVWYRGHADKTWKLVPSVARTPANLAAEATLIKRFKQNALPFIQRRPNDEWEWMFLLQHYGVPTRLLDWTEAPLVALFFACENEEHHGQDGTVWCLLPTELNKLANVSLNHAMELPFLGVEPVTNSYLPSVIAKEHTTKLKPVAATAIRDSARMYAQLGTFTIIHREAHAIEELDPQKHVWRWIVPKSKKKSILTELSKLAINRLTLFPELSSVAQLAREVVV
jgi:hypothetical protein